MRFDAAIDENGHIISEKIVLKPEITFFGDRANNVGKVQPAGYFHRVPKVKGFLRVSDKLGPFLSHLDGAAGIALSLQEKLRSRGVRAGDDLVVMVVNEGEIDLFLNYACSCRLHNISLANNMVFSGSR